MMKENEEGGDGGVEVSSKIGEEEEGKKVRGQGGRTRADEEE